MFVLGSSVSEQTVGLIGQDVLYRLDLEFDLAARSVRLYRSRGCPGVSLAYWTETPGVIDISRGRSEVGHYEVTVRLNGHAVRAIIDSGAPVFIVTPGAAMSAGVRPQTLSYKADQVVGGLGRATVPVTTVTFDKLEIGDESVSHAKLKVAELFRYNTEVKLGSHVPTHTYDVPSMLLGADFLRSHRVLISSSQNRRCFTYNGGPIFQVVGPTIEAKAPASAAASATPADAAKPKS